MSQNNLMDLEFGKFNEQTTKPKTSVRVNQPESQDQDTGALNTITYEHHEIHEGSHFTSTGFQTLGDNGIIDIALTTPDTETYVHLTYIISGTSQTEIYIYEDSTITGGDTLIPINNNRNSTNESSTTIVVSPTVTTLGTLLLSQSSGSAGTTPSKADAAGVINRDEELVLRRNTTYLFRAISRDTDNIITYRASWYEHTKI